MRAKYFGIAGLLCAPGAAADRVTAVIDDNQPAAIPGHVRRLAPAYVDQGPLPPVRHLELALHLKPSARQQADLDRLLIELQDPASPRYHSWITPEQYADRFAISAADADKITTWLESQGFHVSSVGRARSLVVFDGSAGEVEAAFHADLRQYRSPTATHFANASNPAIPRALADIVQWVAGLDDFLPVPVQQAAKPAYTNPNGSHTLSPGDLAVIYDFQGLLSSGIDGTGQNVVIAGQSDIHQSDFQAWAARYQVAVPNVQVTLVPGYADPGFTNSLEEADLDIEEVAAAARSATIRFVYSSNAYTAVGYAIDQNLAPVINASFSSGCDRSASASEMTSYQSLAQQGNAQGITWLNPSGDSGAAGCDPETEQEAVSGLATQFPADIPEVTAVGGTEFNEQGGTYWASSNTNGVSALSYIPEMAWNDTAVENGLAASTGGVSTFYAKPAWQTGPGVPNNGQRNVPDVAFSASAYHDSYEIYTNGVVGVYGGTSAASPMFAGMVVLLNQYLVAEGAQTQPGAGNLNAMLYRLSQSNPSAFHDITAGNNIVPCVEGTLNCKTGSLGYTAGSGYDLCTGLGSVDLAKLLAAAAPPLSSSVTVSSSANPVYQQIANSSGVSWTLSLTLTNNGAGFTTLTGMTIDGETVPLSEYFPASALAASGSLQSTSIGFADTQIPQTHTFGFTGVDTAGGAWSAQLSLPFLGFQPSSAAPSPTIAGSTNGASFQQAYAPGMILSLFGTQLGAGTLSANTLPLPTYMENFEATVNGILAPLYFVSPAQVNLQIPYGTPAGAATLVVYQGGQSATGTISIAPSAPGIFTDANGNTIPYAGGSAGETLVLFITGDGEVSPPLASGTPPSTSLPVTGLPQSILPVTLSIGGQPAQIAFDGIPYGLVGVTQINFVVPAGLAAGPQSVVVTVGMTPSKPATFTIQ